MNLVVDCGNTSAKVGIFDKHVLREHHTFIIHETLENFLRQRKEESIIVSSVSTDALVVASWATQTKHKFILNPALPIPIVNRYATPETLGVDRLAGICGAIQLFPGENTLLIDAGTCITYDFADKEKNYLGGAISPGLKMRFSAVHTFTAKLPLVDVIEDPLLIGNSTETCIQSGVVNGTIAEINGVIAQYNVKFKDLKVILGGGDARFFENKLKASIFASPNVVLIGLNSILIHNVNL